MVEEILTQKYTNLFKNLEHDHVVSVVLERGASINIILLHIHTQANTHFMCGGGVKKVALFCCSSFHQQTLRQHLALSFRHICVHNSEQFVKPESTKTC